MALFEVVEREDKAVGLEHEGLAFNLLDTPGHQDFSEDTYRTLTAVDSVVMVPNAAQMRDGGSEERARTLLPFVRLPVPSVRAILTAHF